LHVESNVIVPTALSVQSVAFDPDSH